MVRAAPNELAIMLAINFERSHGGIQTDASGKIAGHEAPIKIDNGQWLGNKKKVAEKSLRLVEDNHLWKKLGDNANLHLTFYVLFQKQLFQTIFFWKS